MKHDDRHVFIVEDDRRLSDEISAELFSRGYSVRTSHRTADGIEAAKADKLSALIMDRVLGDEDGLDAVGKLRDLGVKTPVLVISGLSTVDHRIEGLVAGGDDYLVKPFELRELGARVDALVRRLSDVKATHISAGDIAMDLLTRSVSRAGRQIDLVPREFKLLEYFVRRPNRILTRKMLLEHVWNYSLLAETNVVDVHIGHLRKK
ncbi:MAG: response regulator transcription factor, partial [Hyphomicrobiales bacterium]|nr:response regulator transcription factor [Hyphomicrobiales bacterium]